METPTPLTKSPWAVAGLATACFTTGPTNDLLQFSPVPLSVTLFDFKEYRCLVSENFGVFGAGSRRPALPPAVGERLTSASVLAGQDRLQRKRLSGRRL
jgi:hypothetical protein